MQPSSFCGILNKSNVKVLVNGWLSEDLPNFDYASYAVGDKEERAFLLCKSPGVVCGIPFFDEVFTQLDCHVEWFCEEGSYIGDVSKIAVVSGKVNNILKGERVALNCFTRACGVATLARKFNELKLKNSWAGEIAGTRKTTPGFRLVEKYALLVGGVSTHRYDLSSMVMLKDNHIWSCGSISAAVKAARSVCGFSTKIEVECRSKEEASEAIESGADIVMLDNFSPEAANVVSTELKDRWPKVTVEASGGIDYSNVSRYMLPCIDVISVGKLTQGYETVDLSLKIDKEGRDPKNETVTF